MYTHIHIYYIFVPAFIIYICRRDSAFKQGWSVNTLSMPLMLMWHSILLQFLYCRQCCYLPHCLNNIMAFSSKCLVLHSVCKHIVQVQVGVAHQPKCHMLAFLDMSQASDDISFSIKRLDACHTGQSLLDLARAPEPSKALDTRCCLAWL